MNVHSQASAYLPRVSQILFISFIGLFIGTSGCASTEKQAVESSEKNTPSIVKPSKKETKPSNKQSASVKKVIKNPPSSYKKSLNVAKSSKTQTSEKSLQKAKPPKKTAKVSKKSSTTAKVDTVSGNKQALAKTKHDNKRINLPLPAPENVASLPELTALENLPLNFEQGWKLNYETSPLILKRRCVLTNEAMEFFDGYKNSGLKIWLTLESIELQSASNFDLSYPNSGVYFYQEENNNLFYSLAFSNLQTSVTAELNDDITTIDFQSIIVKTGFWPTWPVTQTSEIAFAVAQSKRMLEQLTRCKVLVRELK